MSGQGHKDNTVPFNVQLDAERKNSETEPSITEADMDQKEVDFKSKDKKQVMDINVETQKYDTKKIKALKAAEGKKDTAFWDKYVGVQLEGTGQPTKIKDNIPASASQLPNNPDRFKGEKVNKMVMASIKDADAMLFHIYATVAKAGRNINKQEKQQITDINAGKMRIMAQMIQPVRRSLEYPGLASDSDIIIKPNMYGKWLIYESNRSGGGEPIDEFDSQEEALMNYPEGRVLDGELV